jgi:hypothetical protein
MYYCGLQVILLVIGMGTHVPNTFIYQVRRAPELHVCVLP